jgi:hypothetical protein
MLPFSAMTDPVRGTRVETTGSVIAQNENALAQRCPSSSRSWGYSAARPWNARIASLRT